MRAIVHEGQKYVLEAEVEQLLESRRPAIERTYSVAQLHELSGISASTIYRAMDEGRLGYVMPNGNKVGRRVRQSQWDRFMDSCSTTGCASQ